VPGHSSTVNRDFSVLPALDPFFLPYGTWGWLFPLPTSRHISSGFLQVRYIPAEGGGLRRDVHNGTDFISAEGSGVIRGEPVFAPHDGIVESWGWGGSAGYMVALRTRGVYISRYIHLLNPGDPLCGTPTRSRSVEVSRGTRIGSVGTTGIDGRGNPTSTGYHLHMDVRNSGGLINPERFFPFIELTGNLSRN